ncbi:phosphoenolpyruvate--protein phosphotransferase [Marinihelvus fidelis]|uniref:Phosphoenolpyruvate-protein phosphotransferase n=1 Tax=Marinihelvus fidelis TaxID=2613842 RepID=A0A5N0TG23_9GAMM|nr:phosphoenolpyruvate--protein phosphotransferase [Marinihelvus fidelis]KAA9133428.1 phosphoenolpyruvate--protein phosphotransferase [Marinihelvus fidelis]
MTLALSGHRVEDGIAVGRAHVLQRNEIEIGEFKIASQRIPTEIERLRQAFVDARANLSALAERLQAAAGASASEIIRTHVLMLDDSSLLDGAIDHIENDQCNAEWAMQLQLEALLAEFRTIDDDYIRSRADDAAQVVRLVQKTLAEEGGGEVLGDVPDRLGHTLVIATELTPGEMAVLHERGVAGVVTEHGSPYSHTAILARGMGIPTVMGVRRAQSLITEGEQLILDGHYGVVFADPEESILRHYLQKQSESVRFRQALDTLRASPAASIDHCEIALLANAERPDDMRQALQDGACGVGLYRSEFLFMSGEPPDEEQQLAYYTEAIEALGGAPLTIRTLDIGADKTAHLLDFQALRSNPNPALGLRAVRLCLREVELFKIQLRAILRASARGPVRMLVPMLTTAKEARAVRALLDETRSELERAGQAYDAGMPMGGMIEVPAAALSLESFAGELDFLSIGTNDLIQYMVAADRVDEHVAHLYDPQHPGVIHLLGHVFETAHRLDLPVAVCGEIAGDRRYTRLLLALGLTEFSVQPRAVLEVKKVINETDVGRMRGAMARWREQGEDPRFPTLVQYLDHAQLHG